MHHMRENETSFREATDRMLAIYDRLKEQGFSDLKYLDMGGGLGIDYQRHVSMGTGNGSGEYRY